MSSMGWIKLHRQLQECPMWYEERFSKGQAWVDLLLLANHSDKKILFNGEIITVCRGQYLTSMVRLAEKWKWDRKTVSKFLKLLQKEKMVTLEVDNTKTLITIDNYSVYQSLEDDTMDNRADKGMDNHMVNHTVNPMVKGMDTNNNDKECINNVKECNKNGEYNSEPPTEHFDLEKNAAVLFRQWGNKNGFANMKVEWLNRFMGVPERNWMQLANIILQAVKAYKEEYKRTHPDEKVDYQYLKTMDKFFQEDLDYWLAEIQRRKESEE